MECFSYHNGQEQTVFQQMSPEKQTKFLQELKQDYQQIILIYFTNPSVKIEIEQFTDKVFLSNMPVPQVIQIHMELIDEFAKQLKLEGRSEEILLDYRLTLIEILAHLCEMYRRHPFKFSPVEC
ncbi:KaiA domain-containing protein [Chlorogloea sp. CCALA 695]|uniref:KaiA domain-containing protein n=1 Tax=Chlorogloea sp. CCALA 695 TaxID=2107693 RepID=UPI000D0830F2|nr:KaiA domain-containing protein [Chlorogloea sp. CCALA 695]PSB32279.1 KaiA domain-containing protein [Chlorogloea sp. CCALA 695]